MIGTSKASEFLQNINDKVGGYLWLILAAAVVLLVIILFIVIGCKNRRIKKLKRELKNTRTKLEAEHAKFDEERSKFESERSQLKTESAKLKSERAKLQSEIAKAEAENSSADANVDQVEFDDSTNSPSEEEIEQMWQQLSYYNRPTEVSQKGGNIKFIVLYDRIKDSWVIKRSGSDRVVRRVDTKEEAMSVARTLCKKHDASLVVHKKDGKFQKVSK